MDDFLHRTLPGLGRKVHRLGLSANFGLDEGGVRAALDRGLSYVFYVKSATKSLDRPLREALAHDRERYVVATGPSVGYTAGAVRKACERTLRALGTDYVDVFQLFWLGVGSSWGPRTRDELLHLKDEGKVHAVGVSIHDRERAGRLAGSGELGLLMLRYNAAHPGAEQDVFPHLPARTDPRRPAVVAYTATRWRKLLAAPRGWTERVPSAADCYRFCLSSPEVDVVLCGPSSVEQLDQNLAGIAAGPLSDEEMTFMRRFGKAVHDRSSRLPW